MARLSYQRELLSWSLLPVMLAAMQGGTIAVFVKKTFAGIDSISATQLNFAVALVTAARAIGMLTSFLWAGVSRGRPKVRLISALQFATAIVIGLLAFAQRNAMGLWLVTGLSIVAWMIWTGVSTLRASVWRANYAYAYRPSVAGNLSIVYALIAATTGLVLGLSLDWNPDSYRIIFPILAAFGVAGALCYGLVPFRRETQQLTAERAAVVTGPRSPAIARVLLEDRPFRAYMACMFTMGMGNLMIHPILAIVLSDQFQAGYITGIAITTVIPLLCMTLAIPFWSRRLQRMHVIEYRAVHVWTFTIAAALSIAGVATDQIGLLYLAAIAVGIGWGGGVLAWNLGHQHFAPRDRDAEYMGVHITLTGIRGFVGPLLAVGLYGLLAPFGLQVWVFVICLLMNVLGGLGFVALARAHPMGATTERT
jgi:MFS family permease